MEPSGDGELNQIFMIAKNGNIKLYEPPPSTTVHTYTYFVGGKRESEEIKCTYMVLLCVIRDFNLCM